MYIENLTDGKPEKNKVKGLGKEENNNTIPSHASNIFDFLKLITKFHEIRDDIASGSQKHKIHKTLTDYMDIIREYYQISNLFSKYTQDQNDLIFEEIENFILKKMYRQ
jgi:hypothetical protein